MARGTIITNTLGKVRRQPDDSYAVVVKGRDPKESFRTEIAADEWCDRHGPKRYKAVIAVEVDGKRKQKTKTFSKRKDAEAWLDRYSTDVREGTFRELKKATFGDYIRAWKTTWLPRLKPLTVDGYQSVLSRHLLPEFEHRWLMAIDAAEIRKFETRLLTRLSPQTVRNITVLLGRILTNARQDGYLRNSPMENIAPTKVRRTQKGRVLQPAEVHKLLEQCDPTLRAIVLIGLLAGLRRAEIFALHWTDDPKDRRSYIDFEAGKIRIQQTIFFRHGKHWEIPEGEPAYVFITPKSKQSVRDVPLSPMLKKELQSHFLRANDKEGLLFQTGNATPLDPNNVCRWIPPKKQGQQPPLGPASTFNKAARIAGIGPVRFHDLRHLYGSTLLDQGVNIYDVSRWMGHSSIQITVDVYGHLLTDHGAEAAAKADAVYFPAEKVAVE